MQPPSTLSELADQLGRTYSPFERLKILSRAWALLRQMTPEQRLAVAAQLGLDHADEVVEAIARRSGQQASPALISMIEKAQVKGTPHLPELIADLRDPGKRAERLRQGAKTVLKEAERSLAGGEPEVPWLPPGVAAQPAAAPKNRAAPAPAARRTQVPPLSPNLTAPAPALPEPAASPRPVPPSVIEQAPAPAPPPPPAVQAAPPPPEPAPVEAPPPPVPKPQPVLAVSETRPAPARSAGDEALARRLAEASSLTDRFHVLRRHLAEAKTLSAEGLRSVIEAFPDGWARRRALVALLRSGAPGAVREALALVATLGSDRDRLWCLGALTDSRKLSEGDREALLAAATSPMARRRLEVRLGEG